MNSYEVAEKDSTFIATFLSALYEGCVFCGCFTLLQTLNSVLIEGKYLGDAYALPFYCVLPFQVNTWRRYAFAFFWTYLNFVIVGVDKLVASCIQITLCFYTIAVIQDVRCKAKEFNTVG